MVTAPFTSPPRCSETTACAASPLARIPEQSAAPVLLIHRRARAPARPEPDKRHAARHPAGIPARSCPRAAQARRCQTANHLGLGGPVLRVNRPAHASPRTYTSHSIRHVRVVAAGSFAHVRGGGGHGRCSSRVGRPAKESRTWSGVPVAPWWVLGRYLPVLTRTPVSPWRWAASTSVSMSSPIIRVCAAP